MSSVDIIILEKGFKVNSSRTQY